MGEEKNEKNIVIVMARTMRTIIKTLAAILVFVYGWLKLGSLPIGAIVGGISDDVLVKIALCIYFLSWVAGTMNDTDEQETAYAKAPNQGRFPWQGVAVCIIVAAVFGILCCVDSAKWFGFWLAVFLALNIGGYCYLRSVIEPVMTQSKDEYNKDHNTLSILKLEIVQTYLIGNWQWYRFTYGFAVIGLIITMCYSQLPDVLNAKYPAIPPQSYIALSVFFYVITFEGWIWIMRIWSKQAQRTVDFVFKELRERGDYPARGAVDAARR